MATGNLVVSANNSISLYQTSAYANTTVQVSNANPTTAIIPQNNSSGLYNASGVILTPQSDVIGNNFYASGNIEALGYISAIGNVYGDYIYGNGYFLSDVNGANIVGGYGNAQVAAYLQVYNGNITAYNISTFGNITTSANAIANNIQSNTLTVNTTATFGNIHFPNGASIDQLVNGLQISANAAGNICTGIKLVNSGQGNLFANTSVVIQSNSCGTAHNWLFGQDGNFSAPGNISAAGNISLGNNIIANGFYGNTVSVTGQITGGNISAVGNILANNVTAINTVQGNLLLNIGPNIRLGNAAGETNQALNGIAIGNQAGQTNQGANSIAIGRYTAVTNQGFSAIAIGWGAGEVNQGGNTIAIGFDAGNNVQGNGAIAIGYLAGWNTQGGNSIAIGRLAANNAQGSNAIAIGRGAGLDTQGNLSIAIGLSSGNISQGQVSVALGYFAGNANQGSNAIAIGRGAGQTSQGETGIAIGQVAGNTSQGSNAIAIGRTAGQTSQGDSAIALGRNAGNSSQSANALALGRSAGNINQGTEAIAIGHLAGDANQGNGAIAIGFGAGNLNQAANSIVITAGGNLTSTNQGFYVNPVRQDNTNLANAVYFNTTTKELTFGYGNPYAYSNANVANYLPIYSGVMTAVGNIISTGTISTVGSVQSNTMLTGNITANYFIGDGSYLSNINAANVTGLYSNANVASYLPIYSGVMTAVGNIISTGLIKAVNLSASGNVSGNYIIGDGSNLSNITGSNISGSISVTGNITGGNIRTAGQVTATGNVIGGNVSTAGLITATGNITGGNIRTAGQITATGNVYGNVLVGNTINTGNISVTGNIDCTNLNATSNVTGNILNANRFVGNTMALTGNANADSFTAPSVYTSHIYAEPGSGNVVYIQAGGATASVDGDFSWLIGNVRVGQLYANYLAFGANAGIFGQNYDAIAIGANAGARSQGVGAVALGYFAGNLNQGDYSIAVGYSAGKDNLGNNSIILNASGTSSFPYTTANNTFTVNPIRNDNANISTTLYYNTTTKEITYAPTGSAVLSGNLSGNILANGYFINNLTALSVNGNVTATNFIGNITGNIAISTTGNITASYFIGNGSQLSSITGANVTGTVANATYAITAGSANTANSATTAGTVTTNAQPNITSVGTLTSLTSTGLISTTGNISGNYILGNGSQLTGIISSYSNTNVASYLQVLTSNISTTGNVTASYFIGNGSQLTGIISNYGNSNVANYLPTYTGNFTANNISTTGNILFDGARISGTGNIYAGNVITANTVINNGISTTGNILFDGGTISGTGNIYGGNIIASFLYGDGSNITGVTTGSSSTQIQVKNTSGGTLTAGTPVYATGTVGATTVLEVSASRSDTPSTMPCLGLLTTDLVNNAFGYAMSVGTLTSIDTSLYTVDQVLYVAPTGGLTATRPTGTNLVQPVGSVGRVNGTNGSIATNVWNYFQLPNLGNGNVWQGNASGFPTEVTAYGNANVASYLPTYAGNITADNISTTGNITASYFIGNGSQLTGIISSYSNTNVASYLQVLTSNISTTGNITASYFIGNGSQLTSLNGSNVTGTVANATYATTAGTATSATTADTVTTNAQPNITSVGTLTSLTASGLISTTGNISGNYILGNGSQLTGLPATYGNSDVANYLPIYSGVFTAVGNIRSSGFTSVVGNISGGNVLTAGLISATGNVTGAYIIGNGSQLTSLNGSNVTGTVANATYATTSGSATTAGTVTTAAQPNITSVGTLTSLTATGLISTTGNISGNYILGNGSQLTGLPATYGNADVANYLPTYSGVLTAVGNIASSGYVSAVGNVTGGNILTIGIVSATSNITGGNILTSGRISATGNIQGNFILGDGSQLTNLPAGNYGNANVAAYLPTYTGNLGNTGNSVSVQLVNYKDVVYAGGNATGTITPDAASGSIYKYTLTGNITLNAFGGTPQAGQHIIIVLTQDATGNRLLTSTMKWAGGFKTLSTAANAVDIATIWYDGSTYYGALTRGYA